MKDKRTASYLMFIASMLIFGTIGIFRRYIPLSSGMLAFTRGAIGAICLCVITKLRGGRIRHNIGMKKLLLLMTSGALMGINWILLFEAYNDTSVATATLCYYMEPTIVILVSPFLLKEHLTPRKLICALTAVVGMIFVSGILTGGEVSAKNTIGILCGLGAACFYASVVIFNKKVSIEDSWEKTIIQLLSAAVIMIPYLLITEKGSFSMPDVRAIVMLTVVCLIHTGLAYALYFTGMTGLSGQSAAVLSYIDPVSALILSAVILHEHMNVYGIIGAVLIVGSALVSELQPKRGYSR